MNEAEYLFTVMFIFLLWVVVVTAIIWLMSKIPDLVG